MTRTEFKRRRRQLMRMMGKDSIAILPTAAVKQRNSDVHYSYRPDSDFYYLTGFAEPEAVAVLIPGRKQGEYILFCREKDPDKERWDGPIAGQEGAVNDYDADDSFPISDLDDILPRMLEQCERVFYAMGCNPELDQQMSGWVSQLRSRARSGVHPPQEFIALDHYLHDMRLYKSRSEIALMRKAARISSAAHKRIMRDCKAGIPEYQLEADFVHECTRRGARQQAYSPIVGSGNNATVLHYVDNDSKLQAGDLVLVDAGCELEMYASDITRTFPVSGKFSEPQAQIYQLVLDAQLAAIKQVKPGNPYNAPHKAAVRTLTRGLLKLGLLKGNLNQLIKNEKYKKFFMHGTGHWLGMDVHDVGDYKIDGHWRQLEPGMVLTIEPGLYIPLGSRGVAKKWQGIGIRIEDDILVTRDGCDILSADAPKSIAEIEAIMGRGR
ncbi:aminopeptidase P N-terminal domain-containing protein [Thiolapillus sp.]